MFETFHFLRPDWLWAIIPVSLLLFFSIKSIKHSSAWNGVCDAPLLQYQLTQQQNNTKKSSRILRWLIPFSFLMLVFSLTILALAGPSWEKKDQPVFQQEDALVIILDLSLSMNAEDIKPSRLERAKLKLTDILKQKKEGQTALVAFAGDAHIVSPLTIDNKTIISLLPALDITIMPLSGSHISDALSSAEELLKNSGFMHGDILLMTDGIDENHQKKVRQKIKNLRNQGYNLSIIGIGSRAGSPVPMPGSGGFIKDNAGQVVLSKLNAPALKELAELGGGYYHTLSLDDSDFQRLVDKDFSNYNKLTGNNSQDNYQEKEHEQWVDAGAYITLLILPLALLVFRKGLLSISLLFLISSSFFIEPTIAQAAESETAAFTQFTQNKSWKNLWSTADQQGQTAFNSKKFTTAAEQFSNAHWKAGSYYRAGKFEQALEQYEQLDDADSLFNKGNSLAQLQQYEEAIQSYDDALEKNPDLSDAVKNRAAIKEFLDKQKQQSEQQQQQEPKNDKNENKDKEQQQNKDQDSQQESSEQENSDQEESDQSQQQDQQDSSEDKDSEQDSEQSSEQNSEQQDPQNNQSEQPDEAADEKQNQSQQQQAEDQAEEKNPQRTEQQEVEKTDAEAGENTADDVLSQLSQEEQQSLKQWLQRIPDNPGELLRIKFRNNSLNKQRQQNTPEQYEGNPW